MKRISLIILAVLTLALLVYTNTRTPKVNSRTPKSNSETPASEPQTDTSTDQTTAMQNRLNRYFQNAAIPKLKPCWKDVQGKGEITVKFTYTKAGSSWVPEKQEVKSSTLPKGQDAVALRCLQDSVHATSFPVEQGDVAGSKLAAKRFVVYWSWPVPPPADGFKLAKPSNQNAASKACYQCVGTPEPGFELCQVYWWGWYDCDPTLHPCQVKDLCLGGGYGVAGTTRIALYKPRYGE